MEHGFELYVSLSQGVLSASSSLLDPAAAAMWGDLPRRLQAQAATRLLAAVEDSAFLMANSVTASSRQFDQTSPNIGTVFSLHRIAENRPMNQCSVPNGALGTGVPILFS